MSSSKEREGKWVQAISDTVGSFAGKRKCFGGGGECGLLGLVGFAGLDW